MKIQRSDPLFVDPGFGFGDVRRGPGRQGQDVCGTFVDRGAVRDGFKTKGIKTRRRPGGGGFVMFRYRVVLVVFLHLRRSILWLRLSH